MKFEISAIIPLAILFLVNSIQAMGDFSATTSGGMDRLPTDRELNGGIIGYGIGILSALFGCPPTATFSQNVGIVGTTKVISRRVFATSAGILLVAGLIPKFSALLRTIPQCVLGGAVVSVFASIAMTGIRLLVTEKLTARNATVAGLSIAIGMGVSLSGGCLDQMTQSIHSALNLSMNLENFQGDHKQYICILSGCFGDNFRRILNLILPKEKNDGKGNEITLSKERIIFIKGIKSSRKKGINDETVIQRRNGSQRGRSEKDRSFGKRGKDSCGREKS